jgi:hypothetical protein
LIDILHKVNKCIVWIFINPSDKIFLSPGVNGGVVIDSLDHIFTRNVDVIGFLLRRIGTYYGKAKIDSHGPPIYTLMSYYSKKLTNFRDFVEQTTSGAYSSNSEISTPTLGGKSHPQITLDFPTETKRGEIFRVTVQGANYNIQIAGGITVLIPRKIYHKRYDRLPQAKTKDRPGDMATAVFYRFKDGKELNYKLKSFDLDKVT